MNLPLVAIMNDSDLLPPDSALYVDSALIHVLALNFQHSQPAASCHSWMTSLDASVVMVDWRESIESIPCSDRRVAYDLILVAENASEMTLPEMSALKERTGAGLVVILRADSPKDSGSVECLPQEGMWNPPSSLLPVMWPLVQAFCGERKRLLMEHRYLVNQLHDAEYRLEMASVASTVLHNVGNVLNSVNVAGKVLEDLVSQSSVVLVNRMSDLLKEHEPDWGTFLSQDPKGKKIIPLFMKLGKPLIDEQQALLKEIRGVQRHLSHVRQIILSHQAMARDQGQVESAPIEELLEQALELSFQPGDARWVTLQRELSPVPPVLVDPNQLLQILVNLFRNAKQAMEQQPGSMHTLTVSTRLSSGEASGRVEVIVQDTGVGIAPDHVSRMFSRGFTTKKDGNGIGLHSSARTLEKFGGSLSVESAGVGFGATFILAIPVAQDPEGSR